MYIDHILVELIAPLLHPLRQLLECIKRLLHLCALLWGHLIIAFYLRWVELRKRLVRVKAEIQLLLQGSPDLRHGVVIGHAGGQGAADEEQQQIHK